MRSLRAFATALALTALLTGWAMPAQAKGYPMTKSPDATVLFHGRMSDAQVLELVARHSGITLPANAVEQLAQLVGQRISTTSCLVLRTSLLEKMMPDCRTFSVVVFYGRNVNFDKDIDLALVSAQVLALDKNGRLFFTQIPRKGGGLTPQEIRKRGLKHTLPFVEVRRK